METVTNFGDLAVILPATAIVALGLLARAGMRHAAVWLLAIGGCAAVTGALKIMLFCGWLPLLTVPSGHAAMSTVLYGGLGFLAAEERPQWQRSLLIAITAVGVGLIACSRVMIGAHSPGEVIVGLIVGSAFLWILVALMRRQGAAPRLAGGAPWIVIAVGCTALLFLGHHLVTPRYCLCCGNL